MKNYYGEAVRLLKKMTLREKIGQICQIAGGYSCYEKKGKTIEFNDSFKAIVEEYGGIGAISGLLRADPWTKRCYGNGIELEEREECAAKLQQYLKENTRLGIPALIEIEASHGLQALGSVTYPTNICMGSTFNPALYGKIAEKVGQEIAYSDNHVAFDTVIDISKDPRWGRCEETFGEDIFLAKTFAAEAVKGIKKGGAFICAKHFFGAGGCQGGHNQANIYDSRELWEENAKMARELVDNGCDFIMVSYNQISGVPMHMNKNVLNGLLREKFGYKGVIISDGCAVRFASELTGMTPIDTAVRCLQAGIDLSLSDLKTFTHLEEAVERGIIEESTIDTACTRILEVKYRAGLFDHVKPVHPSVAEFVKSGECQQLAYRAACEGTVMVKNDGVLPLKKTTKICLVGENIKSVYYLLGDYTSEHRENEGASIKKAFSERFDSVSFEQGWSFTGGKISLDDENINACDVICLCLGGSSVRDFNSKYSSSGQVEEVYSFMDCGEGRDVASLELPGRQDEALRELKKFEKPIVAVLIQGRAYAVPLVSELANAILIGWYPGQEGARAIADICLGKINPSGKLPVTVPRSSAVLPVYYNHIKFNEYANCDKDILYPFGYGRSYSSFVYSALEVKEDFTVSVNVTNTSDMAGKEVVQVYCRLFEGEVIRPEKELVAFSKVEITPHQTKTVRMKIDKRDFETYINGEMKLMHKKVRIYVGSDSNAVLSQEAIL